MKSFEIKQAEDIFISELSKSFERHMPTSLYQMFQRWAISPENPFKEEWLKTLGIPQFSRLTIYMVDLLVSSSQWKELLLSTGYMNTYLLYETISDNLALGCVNWLEKVDPITITKRKALINFNNAMITKLATNNQHGSDLLYSYRELITQFSLVDHSLSGIKQRKFIDAFMKIDSNHQFAYADIEYGGWVALVANIEACADILEIMYDSPIYSLLKTTLIQRYTYTNELLDEQIHSLNDMLEAGASTILVQAVLTYYYGVISNIKGFNLKLEKALSMGLPQKLMYDAAILIRLLNDIGPDLLQNKEFVEKVVSQLDSNTAQSGSIYYQITQISESGLTRLKKDIEYGEFNICLSYLSKSSNQVEDFRVLILHLANLYKRHYRNMIEVGSQLDQHFNDNTFSILAIRFVKFHEEIYRHPYHTNSGEYAV